jgi:hypothetical protein
MTDKDKIKKDLKIQKQINELKVKRNSGELTPEVIKMCSDCLDEACDWVVSNVKLTQENIDGIHAAAEALKKEPEWLAKTTQFIDVYEEVLVWNKMIDEKVIPASATMSHRECDIALFNSICDRYRGSHTSSICRIFYNYAYRNADK